MNLSKNIIFLDEKDMIILYYNTYIFLIDNLFYAIFIQMSQQEMSQTTKYYMYNLNFLKSHGQQKSYLIILVINKLLKFCLINIEMNTSEILFSSRILDRSNLTFSDVHVKRISVSDEISVNFTLICRRHYLKS